MKEREDLLDFGYWWLAGESARVWYRQGDGALLCYTLWSPSPLLLGRFPNQEAAWAHLGWGRGRRVLEVYFPSLQALSRAS